MSKRTGRLTLFNVKMAALGWVPKRILTGEKPGTSVTMFWVRAPSLEPQDAKYFGEHCVEGAEYMYATMEFNFERMNISYHPDPFVSNRSVTSGGSSDLERIAHTQVRQRIMATIKADYQHVYSKTIALWDELMTVELEQ